MKILKSLTTATIAATAICAAVFLFGAQAQAAVIIDQNNAGAGSGTNEISRPQAQSFLQAGDNIAGAAVRIDIFGASGTMTLSIYDALPGTGGNLVASGTGPAPTIATEFGDEAWMTVFWTAVAVVPETELFLEVTGTNGDIGLVSINSSPYTRGTQYIDGNPSGKNADFAFRTYTDTAFSAAIPAPGAIVIFGLGFAGIAYRRRR
jgi:hypothetical protein